MYPTIISRWLKWHFATAEPNGQAHYPALGSGSGWQKTTYRQLNVHSARRSPLSPPTGVDRALPAFRCATGPDLTPIARRSAMGSQMPFGPIVIQRKRKRPEAIFRVMIETIHSMP
jgi:hypothetical protein